MARSILMCPAKQRCCGRLAGGLESFDHFSVFCFLLTQKEWCTSGWKFCLISPWRNSTSELCGWDILLGNIIMSIKQNIHTPVLSLLLSLPYTHGRKVCCHHLFPEVCFAQFIFCRRAPHPLVLQWQGISPGMMNCRAALWQLLLLLNSNAFSSCGGVLRCFMSPIPAELTDTANKLLNFN